MQLDFRLALTCLSILVAFRPGDATSQETASELSQAAIAARDYSYRTAAFGTSISEFENSFSPGFPADIDSNNGTVRYRHEISRHKSVSFHFTHDKLTQIAWFIEVPESMLTKAEQKLAEMFGRPHRILGNNVYLWQFPSVNRRAMYLRDDITCLIDVKDTTPVGTKGNCDNQSMDLGF